MRWSRLFLPTLREPPPEAASAAHRLLLRAGYLRPIAAGRFAQLPLASRSLARLCALLRGRLEQVGAQEFALPSTAAPPQDLFAALARAALRSYKQIPQIWFQIQPRIPDPAPPEAGLFRPRQFLCFDACAFDLDDAASAAALASLRAVIAHTLAHCGLVTLESVTGPASSSFCAPAASAPDTVVSCPACSTAASPAWAPLLPAPAPPLPPPDDGAAPTLVATPGQHTVADVAGFFHVPPAAIIKSLAMVAAGRPYLALVRGDHTLSEAKLAAAAGSPLPRPARPDEIGAWFDAGPGSLGPAGVSGIPILADASLRGLAGLVAGANRDGFHLRNVTPGRDFSATFHDLRLAAPGDRCARCSGPLEFIPAAALARLAAIQASDSGLAVSTASGALDPLRLASCSVSLDLVLAAAAEQHHDADGLVLPPALAPFSLVITPVNFADPVQRAAAETLYSRCLSLGLDPLLDDRDERAGVKFKDADLIGIPFRVTLGKKTAQGLAELAQRSPRSVSEVPLDEVPSLLASLIASSPCPKS